jgi:GT2 family glycosyltransferase
VVADPDNPSISIVVPTRNRPDHAVECARALLFCSGFTEIVFVDQSDESATEKALQSIGDARLRVARSALRGAANGRNVGIDLSSGTVLAFTDDDCRVKPDWVARIADIFRNDPRAAVVCGRVRVPDSLRTSGFAIEFEPQTREWLHRFPPPDRDWGITANLAARRDVFNLVGRFDPLLGAGGPLLAGEEPDLLFRALKAGLKVVNAREVEVAHLGVRSFGPDANRLWHAYGVGTAAALFKHVRLGDAAAARLYAGHLAVMSRVVTTNLLTGRRPLGLGYTLALLSGMLASFRFRIDAKSRLYVQP